MKFWIVDISYRGTIKNIGMGIRVAKGMMESEISEGRKPDTELENTRRKVSGLGKDSRKACLAMYTVCEYQNDIPFPPQFYCDV
jgi:hypothetical protein